MSQNPRPEQHTGRSAAARVIGIILAIVLIAAVGVMAWQQTQTRDVPRQATTSRSAPATAATTASPTPSRAATPSPTAAVPAGCMASQRPITPSTMKIDRMKVSSPVLSLGLDADNAAAAPPKNEPRTVAWYNRGPRPGSAKGKVVLSIHTYHTGGALGNELAQADSGLTKGDLIRMADSSGHQACYRYDHRIKVKVTDYDPESDIIYADSGAPMLAIVICWDYDASRSDWDSRFVFYATPVTA
ncbi:class F sortase [Acidipropionibacterium virtanenii]|uniref:Sortase family protein n=1 Tax=Acidipropionibacterium virtanenii TaxID=2057246 RepID=A0A344UV78_9ACTN|nr:class F sortase [Acidipropionibacterium virtanenii]AXE39176.1 hypothetical protein JS278_02022 [Acidipropionibacterium virtanenii]